MPMRTADLLARLPSTAEGSPGFSWYGRTKNEVARHAEEAARRAEYARSSPTVLRAAGVRIERASPEKMRLLAGHKQAWQALAWGYRDLIPELRAGIKFRANNIGRTKFFIAQINPDAPEDEPLPVSMRDDEDPTKAEKITLSPDLIAAAEDELQRLPLGDSRFLSVWSENWDVAGEAYLHGRVDPVTGREVWTIRSVLDVDVRGNGMTIKNEIGQPREVNLDTEFLFRLWLDHPAQPHLADSALNAMSDVLEDIVLTGRELRAAARSRVAANGVWMLPDGMIRVKNVQGEADDPTTRVDRFMADFGAAFIAPIADEGSPSAVVPVVLTGSREDIATAKDSFLRFDREDSPTLLAKLEAALKRMATGLDIPPEILSGMAEVNHWTAWQIDASTFKQYLEPTMRTMADAITTAYLHTLLVKQGFAADEVSRVRAWYSADSITENPNRRQDALDARDRQAISDSAFRDALGFDDSDAPSPEEVFQMIAAKSGFDQTTALAMMRWAVEQSGGDVPPLPDAAPAKQVAPAKEPPAAPDPSGVGGTGAPDTAPPAVTASAPLVDLEALRRYADQRATDRLVAELDAFAEQAPQVPTYRLDVETGRRLMELDRALRDQLLVAADAALSAARDRAGSRLRSKATKDPSVRASLGQYAVRDWPAHLGRAQALALGADSGFLLAQAWEELSAKFARWVLGAIGRIVPSVLKLTGKEGDDAAAARMTQEMEARIPAAWDHLQARLDELADAKVFGEGTPFDHEGEVPELDVPPALVRAALAEVGGLPEGSGGLDSYGRPITGEPANGLHNGSTVTDALEDAGVATVGYLWVYGITPKAREFHPHAELEGTRFTSWRDPKLDTAGTKYGWVGPFFRPGDHRGCMCDFVPGYAVPDYAQQVRDRLSVLPPNMAEIIALAESDDRAGRRNTTAQEQRDHYEQIQRLQSRFLDTA